MLWRMSAELHLDRIGIMLARLDNLPRRQTSISGPLCGGKEFPVATIRARAIFRPAPATPSHWPLAYRLRKLRELQDPGSGRPALGLGIGITLAETAETPAMARPPDTATGARAGRKGRKGRKPILRCTLWVRQQNCGQQFQSIA